MSQQVDSSLSVPAPIPSVRALQANPEVLTPVRHGFLWKRSRLFKTWISRWFQLDMNGFMYAVSPKVIKRDGQSVLPSPVREVLQLPPQRYRNGATMYGIRVVSAGGRAKDLYTDDRAALDAWGADLSRSTPAAREAAQRKAAAAAAAAAAAQPLLLLPPPPPARAGGELHLADICEIDWSGMLGSGLFACVLRARLHRTGEPVAVKIIKTEAFREYGDIVEREAAVWAAAGQHPHVVALKQTLRSPERMYFIAELCEGGGLVDRLASSATYCEREVAWLARQLLAAVQHLHDNAIVHMDIKPENLVFASRREDACIKLIDFSLASFFYSPTDPGGTPDFVAPELLNQPEHFAKNGCGPEVDMWAVGVMIFFLLSGQTPFQAPTLDAVLQRVKTGEWAFHGRRWALVSEGARDLVSSLLRLDPAQRLSAAEALDHPWLRRPDSLSQALLQDAVSAFRLAATAVQHQARTSWVKQASGDLMTTAGTNATNLSPHTSLSRFAVMAASVGPPAGGGGIGGMGIGMSTAGIGAALTTGGGGHNLMALMSTGAADVVAAMMGPSGAGASSAVMMTSSTSHHQLNQAAAAAAAGGGFGFGGNSRGSLIGGQRSSSAAMAAAAAAAAAGCGGSGGSGGGGGSGSSPGHQGHVPHQHSFTAGVGSRYAAAVAMAPHYSGSGGASPPRLPSGAAAAAVAAAARISPHSAAHRISPHNSRPSPGSGAARSPRSPLGMRTRRASDTMAYSLAITERQESLHQMQAQGLQVPPVAGGMAWPSLTAAKARRASELLPMYGAASASACVGPSPSDSQAELAASAVVAAASVSVDRGNHSAPGTRYLHHHHHLHHHHGHYGQPTPLRGASGLSVMTSAAGVAAARGEGRPTGERSNPELFSMLRLQSSNGGRSGVSSSTETTPHTSSRDGTGVGRNSWTSLPAQLSGQQGQAAGASLPPCDQALLALSKGLKQGVPGKSQSYNVMPTNWLDRPAGRGQSSGQGYNAAAAAGGGGGGGACGGVPLGPVQRRASMSFTLGASVSGLALMPHGPSPLSNSSGGRVLPADSHATAGGGGSGGAGAGAGAAAAAPGPLPALLLLKRPSRGNSGGGNHAARSSSSTPAHASPVNSNANLQSHAYGILAGSGGGCSMSGMAAAGGSNYGSSSSMYAAVLRSNLSGQGMNSGGGGGGGAASAGTGSGGGGSGSGADGGAGGEAGRRQASRSGSGNLTLGACAQDAPAVASSPAAPPVSSAEAPFQSAGPTSSLPSPMGAAVTIGGVVDAVGAGGVPSSNSDPFIFVGGAGVAGGSCGGVGSWEIRQPSDPAMPPEAEPPPAAGVGQLLQEELRGVMYSSSSNVVSGSNLMISDRFATQGSFIEATLMTANVHGSAAMAMAGSNNRGSELCSEAHGRTLGSVSDSSSTARPGGGGRGGEGRRLLQPTPNTTMALLRGGSGLPVAPDSDNEMFSIGFNATAGDGDGGGADAAAADEQLRSQPRSETYPSLLRGTASTKGDDSPGELSPAGGAGGVGGSPLTGSPRGAAVGAAAAMAAAAADSATSSIVETLRTAGLAPRASSRLVLETIPSEDPDSLSGLIRSVREERATAAAAAGGGGGSVGAASCSSGPAGFGSVTVSAMHSPTRHAGPQQQQQQQAQQQQSQQPQPFVMPPSPLSRQQFRAFLSPQASSTSLGPVALLSSSKSAIDPGPGGAVGSASGSAGSASTSGAEEHRLRISGTGAGNSASGAAGVGSSSVRSAGSIRSGPVRRAATVNNLRLHATTAAAAQAAAQAAAAAAAADATQSQPDPVGQEPDPFAGWDYPPPAPPPAPAQAQLRQRASSSVGLSGPSLVALLAQAAPLAQAAQAFAAVQIANSQSSSAGSSFTSQRGGLGGGSGGIRAAGMAAGADLLGLSASAIPLAMGAFSGPGGADTARAASAASPVGVRRSSTTANLSLSMQSSQSQAQLQLQHQQLYQPPAQQQQLPGGGASRDSSAGSAGGPRYLAGILAQAAPLAQAAQASAVAQAATSRAASYTSQLSGASGNAAAAAALIGAGTGGGSSHGMYGGRGVAPGSGTATLQSHVSDSSSAGSPVWARRATTSNDLRDRALAVQISGNSMVHRLASQQGPSLAASVSAGVTVAGAVAGGVHSSSPPRELLSPASVSSRTSTFPAVPSRLSNSGNGTPTARAAGGGLPSPSQALSPHSSLGAAHAAVAAGGPPSQRALLAAMQQQQQQPPAVSVAATYQQQLQQQHQLQQLQQQQQLQQLQQFHNMQQLRHQQQKGAAAAAAEAGRSARPDTAGGGAAAGGGMPQLRASVSASIGVLDSATQAAILRDAFRTGARRTSCTQLPLPQLYE